VAFPDDRQGKVDVATMRSPQLIVLAHSLMVTGGCCGLRRARSTEVEGGSIRVTF
jgi:hypothetical protein